MMNFPFDSLAQSWRPYAVFALLGCLLYAQALWFHDLTYFDDYFFVIESYSFNKDLSNIGTAFLQDAFHWKQGGSFYRPLLTLTWILDAQISGTSPWMFHITNLLLHLSATFLLFRLFLLLQIERKIAFSLTSVFVVHPVLVQAVAWIPGRNDSLLAVVLLSSFYFLALYEEKPTIGRFSLHTFFFLLGLLTKESAVVFPLLCLIYVLTRPAPHSSNGAQFLLLAGWFVALLNWYILRRGAGITTGGNLETVVPLVLKNLPVMVASLGDLFWPMNLGVKPTAEDMQCVPGLISAIVLILLIVVGTRKQWSVVLLGGAWFVLFLLPTLYADPTNVLPKRFYPHRLYLPFVGILFILAAVRIPFKVSAPLRRLLTVSSIVFLSFLSIRHVQTFENALTFWENAAITSPSNASNHNKIELMHLPPSLSSGHFDYGVLGQQERDLTEKLSAGTPDPSILHQRAIVRFGLGYLKKAELDLLSYVKIAANDENATCNLGVLYYRGRIDRKAEAAWLQTLQSEPLHADAYANLSYLCYQQKRYDEAWKYGLRASQLGDRNAEGVLRELESGGLTRDM